MENVQFESKQAAIRPKCADKIAKLAAVLNANQQVVIGLDGHVDDTQANDYDSTLSARRVQAVRQALIAAGIIDIGLEGRAGLALRQHHVELARDRVVSVIG